MCVCVCKFVLYTYTSICVCVCVCVCTYIHIHIHTNTHTHLQPARGDSGADLSGMGGVDSVVDAQERAKSRQEQVLRPRAREAPHSLHAMSRRMHFHDPCMHQACMHMMCTRLRLPAKIPWHACMLHMSVEVLPACNEGIHVSHEGCAWALQMQLARRLQHDRDARREWLRAVSSRHGVHAL